MSPILYVCIIYFCHAQAKITPPEYEQQHEIAAVLPYFSQKLDRAFYTYCSNCVERGMWQYVFDECKCKENERSWVGTYFTGELQAAEKRGYKYVTVEGNAPVTPLTPVQNRAA